MNASVLQISLDQLCLKSHINPSELTDHTLNAVDSTRILRNNTTATIGHHDSPEPLGFQTL